jgi:hypothetical protein
MVMMQFAGCEPGCGDVIGDRLHYLAQMFLLFHHLAQIFHEISVVVGGVVVIVVLVAVVVVVVVVLIL